MFDEDDDERRARGGDPLERVTSRAVEKGGRGVFGYTAGKSLIAERLVKLFPSHSTYTEPFCGSAAVFFAKDAADREVLSDTMKDVVDAHRTLKSLSKGDLDALGRMNWKASKAQFQKVLHSAPTERLAKLYKFLYLARFSFGKNRASYNKWYDGQTANIVKRIEKHLPRYKNAIIRRADYADTVQRYDDKNAFHFLDPPYAGYANGHGDMIAAKFADREFDEKRLRKTLEGVKGRFLVTYGVKGNLDTSGFEVKRMRQSRAIARMGVGGSKILTHLLISNFKTANKSLGDGVELDDVMQIVDVDEGGDRIIVTGSRTSVSVPDSLVPARAWKNEDTLLAYPAEAGPVEAEARLRFLDKRCELDLVFPVNDVAVGWSLAVGRVEFEAAPATVAKAFSIEGSRYFDPVTKGVPACETPRETIADAVVRIDRPRVELGLQTPTRHEYFLTKGDELLGQLVLERDERLGHKYPWLATLIDSKFVPNAVIKGGPMPPDGVSALPRSVEKIVPSEFRYWEHAGDEALLRRDALAASGFLDGSLAMVDGEIGRVVTKFELYEPPEVEELSPAEWRLTKVAEILPADVKLVEVHTYQTFSPQPAAIDKASGDGANVIYTDVGVAKDGVLDMLAKTLVAHAGDYVIAAADSPETRKGLEQFGRPFAFRPGPAVGVDAVKAIFVASFGVRDEDVLYLDKQDAEWLARRGRQKPTLVDEPADDATDLGKAEWTAAYVNDLPDSAFLYVEPGGEKDEGGKTTPRSLRHFPYRDKDGAVDRAHVTNAIARIPQADIPAGKKQELQDKARALLEEHFKGERSFKVVKADDEKFVLGVVLVPDDVDAQNDVYSASEVRQAAHRYMAEFQNRGLMHKELVNNKVDILESYIAPTDFTIGAQTVKRGTWLMAVRVADPKLWSDVKTGKLTGFSIGGSANRQVDPQATSKYKARKDAAKKKIAFQGIPIVIDRPRGFVQHGVDEQGAPWTREYQTDYGYIPRTKGGDGEGLDVFVGPDDKSQSAYWITQKKGDGSFDEYKLMIGYDSAAAARKAYEQHVPSKFFGGIREGTIHQIKALLNQEPEESLAKAVSKILDGIAAL